MLRPPLPVTLCLLVAVTACETSPRGPGGPAPPDRDEGEAFIAWPYWPARMRVHPLSRLVRDPALDREVVETRLEFLDRDLVTTRCFGEVYLELDVPSDEVPPSPASTWLIDLRDPEANANHFDIVTRTYLFKLDFGNEKPPTRIDATYVGADGQELRAGYTLP